MVGLYLPVKSTLAFTGIHFSIPRAQKHPLTMSLRKSSFRKSTDAPIVVVKTRPVSPLVPVYNFVHATGMIDFLRFTGDAGVIPLAH